MLRKTSDYTDFWGESSLSTFILKLNTISISESDIFDAYEQSFDKLNNALSNYPGDSDINNMINEFESNLSDYVIESVNIYTDYDDYESAIAILKKAEDLLPFDENILMKKDELENR